MVGNGRRGVVRKASKKNVGGSGGQKRGLRGKGPTPKAEDRIYHAAHKWANEKRRRDSGRHERKGDGIEPVVGRNPVAECLHVKVPTVVLIMTLDIDDGERLQESVRIADSRGIPIHEVPRHELDTMTGNTMHQGIGLQIPSYKCSSAEDLIDSVTKTGEPGLIVCLDNITDPRSLSVVIHLVATFGGHGVAIPERRSAAITDVAWRISAGTTARLPVVRATNMVRLFKQFQEAGYQIAGLDTGGDYTLDTYDGTTPVVVVVGFEDKDLSHLVRDTHDTIMPIPMTGWMESLNTSIAAGVTLSEFVHQHRTKSSQ